MKVAISIRAAVTPLALGVLPSVLFAQDMRNARVDSLFATFAMPGSPGCAVGAAQDGRLVYGRGYGSANLDHGVPIDTRSVFYQIGRAHV